MFVQLYEKNGLIEGKKSTISQGLKFVKLFIRWSAQIRLQFLPRVVWNAVWPFLPSSLPLFVLCRGSPDGIPWHRDDVLRFQFTASSQSLNLHLEQASLVKVNMFVYLPTQFNGHPLKFKYAYIQFMERGKYSFWPFKFTLCSALRICQTHSRS